MREQREEQADQPGMRACFPPPGRESLGAEIALRHLDPALPPGHRDTAVLFNNASSPPTSPQAEIHPMLPRLAPMEYEANLCGVHGEDVSVEATQRAKRKGKKKKKIKKIKYTSGSNPGR